MSNASFLPDVTTQNIFVTGALSDVANADPANIQQVAASQLALSNSYYQSVLKQAGRSFIAAIVSAAIGLVFFIGAVVLAILQGNFNATIVSSLAGAIVEVIAGLNFWLYARTALQLDAFHVRLERTQRYLLANSVGTTLPDSVRATAISDLIKAMTMER